MASKDEEIVRAATALFSVHGFHAVGIDAIIARAVVAKRTFYKYFPSKEDLIIRALRDRDASLRATISDATGSCGTPLAKLEAVITCYLQWFSSPGFHGCMFIKASDEYPQASSTARQVAQEHKSWLREEIRHFLSEAGVPAPEELAIYVLVVLDGITVQANLYPSTAVRNAKITWQYLRETIELKARS